MNPIVRNVLAVILGLVLGSAINMTIIVLSGSIIPPPKGADVTTVEGLKASMHLFGPKHFIMPFLAHAFGTFGGAIFAVTIAASHKMRFGMAIGIVFLVGGIANVLMLPSPLWFTILDLLAAYIPMAYFAGKLFVKK